MELVIICGAEEVVLLELEGEAADWMRDWERLLRDAARETRTKTSSWLRAQTVVELVDEVRGDFQLMAM